MNNIIRHLKLHRGLYVMLPVTIGFLLFFLRGIYWATGRLPTDDPDILINYCYGVIKAVLIIGLTVFVKSDETINKKFEISNTVGMFISRLSTLGLLLIFNYIISK